ncbi:DUF4345 family protein [Rhodohalobacter sp.]|uniref:DUF4345 family protein n=1 Tax=Rhodohalobacter sp. TaxID=1974210 RepID=UPI002ACE1336|nr:DUF4345 family protein [Rhodohalobacter sp.]MDZ7757706.1 DUF4345 family protein [Rhodohalobacter sp.]
MKFTAYFFFYCYIGLVLLAGFWGAFLGADFDHQLLFNLDTSTLESETRTNLLSQYRFLRAMEFGYGLFAILFTKEIFSLKKFNRLYLAIMFAGVLARLVSVIDDGSPSALFYFFLIFEFIGVVVIYLYFQMKTGSQAEAIG